MHYLLLFAGFIQCKLIVFINLNFYTMIIKYDLIIINLNYIYTYIYSFIHCN